MESPKTNLERWLFDGENVFVNDDGSLMTIGYDPPEGEDTSIEVKVFISETKQG